MNRKDLFGLDADPVPPYTESAAIYDHMMRGVDYKRWAKYIILLMRRVDSQIRRSRIKGKKLCELACGTGNISLNMSKLGYDVTGVDMSKNMLAMAEEKFAGRNRHNSRFLNHDMVTYSSKSSFDVVICTYDSINYIPDVDLLKQFFRSVFSSLKPGGIFVFDASLESNSLSDSSLFIQRGKYRGIYYQRRSAYDSKTKIHTTLVRVKRNGKVFEEVHREYVYKLDTLRELVTGAGFRERLAAADFTVLEPNNESERVHFVLVKPGLEAAGVFGHD